MALADTTNCSPTYRFPPIPAPPPTTSDPVCVLTADVIVGKVTVVKLIAINVFVNVDESCNIRSVPKCDNITNPLPLPLNLIAGLWLIPEFCKSRPYTALGKITLLDVVAFTRIVSRVDPLKVRY